MTPRRPHAGGRDGSAAPDDGGVGAVPAPPPDPRSRTDVAETAPRITVINVPKV